MLFIGWKSIKVNKGTSSKVVAENCIDSTYWIVYVMGFINQFYYSSAKALFNIIY